MAFMKYISFQHCGQKPKFSNSDYCSKTCMSKAAQAAVPPAQPAAPGRSVPKHGARLPATAQPVPQPAQNQPVKTSKSAMRHAVPAVIQGCPSSLNLILILTHNCR